MTTGRPRTRQRVYKQLPPLPVPDIEDDAAERKRVLNVLAQRRYRQRKRLNRLKTSPKGNESGPSETNAQEPPPSSSTGLQVDDIVDVVVTSQPAGASATTITLSPSILAGLDMDLPLLDPLDDISFPPFPQQALTPGTSIQENPTEQDLVTARPTLSHGFAPPLESIDPALMSRVPMSADTYNLPLIGFTLSKALVRIANRLGCTKHWELDCVSPFNHGTATPTDQLPPAWRPTALQTMVPHHPIFDFLPWPGVRDRIINIMTLPDEMRPTTAKGPLALVNFAYDVEDGAEGVRIFGDDPYEPKSWEVGQLLFE